MGILGANLLLVLETIPAFAHITPANAERIECTSASYLPFPLLILASYDACWPMPFDQLGIG
jgi:hypothetical protein